MSDIKIKVTKEKLQSYLDNILVMKNKAELYVNEHNRKLDEKKELHERKLMELLGDEPKDPYYEEYEEIHDDEEVSFEEDKSHPWWVFWKKVPLKCVTKKVPVKLSFVITSDINVKNWKIERDKIMDHLDAYSNGYLRMNSHVYKDIDELTKAIEEADNNIEVDPEYLVKLDNTYHHPNNLYTDWGSELDGLYHYYGRSRYSISYNSETVFRIVNGCFSSNIVIRNDVTSLSSKDLILLEKVKKVSKYHNEFRKEPRNIWELMKEAGLKEE